MPSVFQRSPWLKGASYREQQWKQRRLLGGCGTTQAGAGWVQGSGLGEERRTEIWGVFLVSGLQMDWACLGTDREESSMA